MNSKCRLFVEGDAIKHSNPVGGGFQIYPYSKWENSGSKYRIPNMSFEDHKNHQPEAIEGPLPADR